MGAIAIVQGGPEGHPHAPLWYGSNPVEPIGDKSSLTVKDTTLFETITLDSVLDHILASKAYEIVIVCHGGGSGLDLPLLPGAAAGAEVRIIFPLSADVSREETGIGGVKTKTPIRSDKDVADTAMLTESQVKALRAKMNQIRKLKLKHVAFRACTMGINKDTLEAFRNFFGAASVSAPTQFDSYGTFRPSIGADLNGWAKSMRKSGYQISVEGAVAFGTKDTSNARVYKIECRATSEDEFSAWVKKHITDGGWKTNGVVFHGMKLLHPANRTSPTIAFVRDATFIASIVNHAG
jgi:hypothetical protein